MVELESKACNLIRHGLDELAAHGVIDKSLS